MATVNLGRYRTTPDQDFAVVLAGTMLAVAFPPTSQNLWGTRFRIRMGRNGASTPSVRLALYAKSGSAPAQLLGYSATINPSTQMTSWDTGAFYEADVSFVPDGPTNTAIPIPSGTIPVLAVLATGADLGVGMLASDGTMYDNKFYKRTGLSQPPPDPFGSATVSVEGNTTISLICTTNEPPVSLNNRSPSGTINDTAPSFAADFRDRNGSWGPANGGADLGDFMLKYKVQVRRQSDQHKMWDPAVFTATPSEQSSDHFSVPYAGDTLVRGTTYEWICWSYDWFNEKGNDSSWLAFTPSLQGFVTLNGNPVSKWLDNTPDFDFSWSHQSGQSTNAVQLALYQNNTLALETGVINKTVANGATGTLTWVESLLGTPYPNGLDWGQTWKYAIRGRDTSNNWSDYSARRQFKTDAPPSIPDGLSPASGEIVTSRPLLTFLLSDADDTPPTLIGRIRLFGPQVISNGAFPSVITGWTAGTATGVTRTFAYDGTVGNTANGSGKVAVTASTAAIGTKMTVTNDTQLPVVVGRSYTSRVAVRTDNVNITPRLIIQWYSAANALLSTTEESDWVPTASAWSTRALAATAPANAAYMKIGIELYWDTANQTGNVWLDDASVDNGYRYIRDATYNSTSGLWEYQTTSTDLPASAFGIYKWDAYGWDGTLYSGAVSTEASAVKSPEGSFNYANGPTATITSPTNGGTITSSTPTVTWTSTDQNRYQLTFYEAGTSNVVYRRGWVISAATSWTVPAGYLHNNAVYDVELIVEDSQPLQGYAPVITVTGAFTGPPAATGFSATPITVDGNDPWPTAIQVQWNATTEPSGTFVAYYLYRDDIGLTGTPYQKFTSPDQTSFVDPVPASGREYTYALRVVGQRDLDRVSSARVYASATVNLEGVVLLDVNNPYTYRAVLDDVQSRDRNRKRDEQTFMVGAAEKPITFRSPTSYWEIPGEYRIIPPVIADDKIAAIAQRAAAMDALEERDPVVCYRDERGAVIFGRIADFSKSDLKFYPVYKFSIREENYLLGVALDDELPA